MLEEVAIECPYCGEPLVLEIEPESQGHRYHEDCQVCCKPMVLEVGHDPGGPPRIAVWRDDE